MQGLRITDNVQNIQTNTLDMKIKLNLHDNENKHLVACSHTSNEVVQQFLEGSAQAAAVIHPGPAYLCVLASSKNSACNNIL